MIGAVCYYRSCFGAINVCKLLLSYVTIIPRTINLKIFEMRKLEVIKNAYEEEGFEWEKIKDFVDERGWTYHKRGFLTELTDDKTQVSYRSRKLSDNFDNNNGWVVKEDEFPEDNETVFWINIENYEHETASLLHCDFKHEDYTHWHKLPPKAPIY